MNKKLVSFLSEQHLEIEGKVAYGIFDDYQISLQEMSNGIVSFALLGIQIYSCLNNEEIAPIQEFLKSNKKAFKLISFEVTALGVMITVANGSYPRLLESLHKITEFLKEKNAKNQAYCPVSGEEIDITSRKKVYFNNFIVFINESSANQINEERQRAELEYQNSPNNYLKGVIGALIGGAIGAVVWVVVGALLGVISGWIAFLIAYLAGIGYDKMKGKPNMTKFIVSSLVTLAYVVISMFLVYVLIVKSVMADNGLSGNPVSMLFTLFDLDEKVRSQFILDLVLGLLFGVFGVVASFFQMRSTLHKKQEKI